MCIINNKQKVLSSSTSRRMHIWNIKYQMENLINDDLEPILSDNENEKDSDSETDNEFQN